MRFIASTMVFVAFLALPGCRVDSERRDRDTTDKVEALEKAIQGAAVIKVKAAHFSVEGKNYPGLSWAVTDKADCEKLSDLIPEVSVSDQQGHISSAPYFTIEVFAKQGQKEPDHTFGIVKRHLILVTGTDETVMLDVGDQKLFDHLVEIAGKHAAAVKK